MSVRFLFFSQSSDWVGSPQLDVDVNEPKKIIDLINEIPSLHPLVEKIKWLRIAVNNEFSSFECEVNNGDEVAFIPPISGG